MFHGFEDDYLKCIRSSSLPYDGENLTSKIFTIQRIDKHLEGKTNLTFTEQLCYLLLHDAPYPYEDADELIKEMITMLITFNSDEERWKAYDEDDDRKFDNTLIAEAKIEAREETKLEHSRLLAEKLRIMIKAKFFYVSPYVEKHIVKASFEALCNAIIAVSNIYNPDDLIPILES
ncbi:MAG: hypothetical protein LUG60_12360 [Erysipelotrichaceae bacterium]|nr:hypothetical protein [Erysipelotrichaceae bacterium]